MSKDKVNDREVTDDGILRYATGSGAVSRVKFAQDPMAGGGLPPMDPMMGGGLPGMPPPGGAFGMPPGPPPGAPAMADAPPAGAEAEDSAKEMSLEDKIPDDLKASIQQKVKEKVEQKIQETTGQPAAEMPPEGAPGAEAAVPGAEMPVVPEVAPEKAGGEMAEFPDMVDMMTDDQFEELFNKAKEIIGEEGKPVKGKEKKETSYDEKLKEFGDLEPPASLFDDLVTASVKKTRIIKKADIIAGRMERDGQYWVSCPNTNIMAAIGVPRNHPISQCKNCAYYGDNGDNAGSNLAQIFCSYVDDPGTPIKYIKIQTMDSLKGDIPQETQFPFQQAFVKPVEEVVFKSKVAFNVLNRVGTVRDLLAGKFDSQIIKIAQAKAKPKTKSKAKSKTQGVKTLQPTRVSVERPIEEKPDKLSGEERDYEKKESRKPTVKKEDKTNVKQESVWLKSNNVGEMVVNGTPYKLKRVGNDIEIYDGGKQIDIIRGVVNYNDRFVRENELVARMDKDPSMQTKFDTRRAFYDDMKKFRKYAEDGWVSYKQAFKKVVEEGNYPVYDRVTRLAEMLKDNGYMIVVTANDRHWIKSALRRKESNLSNGSVYKPKNK